MEQQIPKVPDAPAVGFAEAAKGQAFALVLLVLIAVVAMVTLEIFRPDKDNGPMALMISGLVGVVLTYLKAEQSHLAVNHRVTEFLQKSDQLSEQRGYAKAGVEQEERRVLLLGENEAAVLKVQRDTAVAAAEVLRTAREEQERRSTVFVPRREMPARPPSLTEGYEETKVFIEKGPAKPPTHADLTESAHEAVQELADGEDRPPEKR